jgi:spore coat polysaccharide biosynthesis predicted glycosyltransferase SpsG
LNPSFVSAETPPPRLLFKVMGGPIIGMGQVIRSVELARTLPGAGFEIVGFVCNDDACTREIVAATGLPVWNDTAEFGTALRETNPDVLLLDHPGPHHPVCLEARAIRPDLTLVALDCFEMEHADFDLIINLINHHPTLRGPLSPEVEYHEGPAFAIIRREFAARRDEPRRPAGATPRILATFGGSDPMRHTLRVLEALSGASEMLHLTVVVGPNFPHRAEVYQLAAVTGATVHENVRDIATLMLDADLAISGGGTTMLELATLGIPALIIPQNEPETRFSASIAARGAVRTLPLDIAPTDLRREVLALLDDPTARELLSKTGRQIVDGEGQARIADLILQARARRQTVHA